VPTKQPEGKLKLVGVLGVASNGIVVNGVAEGRCVFEPIIFGVMLTGMGMMLELVYIYPTPSVIIVLAGILGGLGVVMAGLKGKVPFVTIPPEPEGKLVCSKKVEEYDADARLVMVRVMVVPATAVTLPLMLSVPE
jgi:hypothetical protein